MILVPVDLSPASLRALQVALELAPQLGAEVLLLQVFPHPAPPAQELPAELAHRYYDEAEAAQRWPLEQLVSSASVAMAILPRRSWTRSTSSVRRW
jgi:nucleotide-binding universal stress UspA family protein